MIFPEEKPSLDSLVHYGTKGMQWGVRKKKPSSVEIKSARARQAQRLRELQRHDDIASTAASPRQRSAATKRAQAIARDFQTNEDRVTAMRMTRGERIANVILLGPIGIGANVINSSQTRATAREVDRLRTQL